MSPAIIHAAITKAHLIVHHAQGHNDWKFPSSGISHTPNGVAGIAVPIKSGTIGRVQRRGFFVPSVLAMLNGGPDRGAARLAVALDGTANPVRTATLDRSLGSGIQPDQEQTIMNPSSTLGDLPEICPSFILRATLEKRVRRELAKQNRKLLKSRPGTPAHREYGLYAIENGLRKAIETNLDLATLARDLGVMRAHERVDPCSDWRFYVARQTTQTIDGKTIAFHERLSGDFRSRLEAEAHADRMNIDGQIGVVGYSREDHRHE
jgi:hypothetical protein